jgi:eukaryotic-like serine/threonine-protein kinase
VTLLDDRAVAGLRALVGDAAGPGDVLEERFELRERIGEGGMGVVWSAWDRVAEREVAVKIATSADDARFALEIDALENVSHPVLVPTIAEGRHDGARFFVMERLYGATLQERLARGRLSAPQAIALARRVADALAAVHLAGIAHRDVKPSNVFLEGDDVRRPRLLDFGVARADRTTITKTGALVGTPGYMAPEQVRGEGVVGPPADIFALGCVLYECLTKRPAFTAEGTETLLAKIMLEAAPSPRALIETVPQEVDALVIAMLDKDPAKRPAAPSVARVLTACESDDDDATPEAWRGAVAVGTVIAGKYRVEERIGEGGMGIVVAAQHLDLGKRVALKILRGGPTADDARFLREARAVSRLESEHVSRVIDVGRADDGTPFIVMEHLSGSDLARHLRANGPLPCETAVRYVRDACEAIAEAHALGIVHRDLKPSNLFLVSRRDGSSLVKVLDFGISKVTRQLDGAAEDVSVTARGAVVGSVAYMSPEQIFSPNDVDARSDIWALGVVLFELVTGRKPFEGDGPAAVGARIAAAKPTRLRELVPDAPAGLEAIIARCLEKEPSRRFPDVTALDAALGGTRTRPKAVPIAIGVAVVLALAGFLVSRTTPPIAAAVDPVPSETTATALVTATSSAAPTPPPTSSVPPRESETATPIARPSVAVRASSASVAPPRVPTAASSSAPTTRARPLDLRDPAFETR